MKVFIIVSVLLLFGCSPVIHMSVPKQENSCIPQAIMCKKYLEKHCVWSRVVLYYYDKRRTSGHAVCVFYYVDKLWTYDHMGSYSSNADAYDPLSVAQDAEDRRRRNKKVYHAKFLD